MRTNRQRWVFCWGWQANGFSFAAGALQRGASLSDAVMAVPVGQQAVVTDFDKTLRQQMQPEAADEFVQGERHFLFAGAVGVILVVEGDGLRGGIKSQ